MRGRSGSRSRRRKSFPDHRRSLVKSGTASWTILEQSAGRSGGFNDTAARYPYFAFLYTLFFTGMRPSELCAVRIRTVNFNTAIIHVDRSRPLGAEAAPKTRRARRAVRLTGTTVEVLKPLIPLRAHPDDYDFRNVRGEPISTTCFEMHNVPWKSRRSMTCILQKTPTSPWRSRMV